MICPNCNRVMDARESMTSKDDGATWQHLTCGGVTEVLGVIETDDANLIRLRATIRRMLDVPVIGDQTPEQYKDNRAANIAQVIANDFIIAERK